jgi:hypothetical protein
MWVWRSVCSWNHEAMSTLCSMQLRCTGHTTTDFEYTSENRREGHDWKNNFHMSFVEDWRQWSCNSRERSLHNLESLPRSWQSMLEFLVEKQRS